MKRRTTFYLLGFLAFLWMPFSIFASDSPSAVSLVDTQLSKPVLYTYGGVTTTLRDSQMSDLDRAVLKQITTEADRIGRMVDGFFEDIKRARPQDPWDYLKSDRSNYSSVSRVEQQYRGEREIVRIDEELGVTVFLNYQGSYDFTDSAELPNGESLSLDANWAFFDLFFISTRSQKLLAHLPILVKPKGSIGERSISIFSQLEAVMRQDETKNRSIQQAFVSVEHEGFAYQDAGRINSVAIDPAFSDGIQNIERFARFVELVASSAFSNSFSLLPPSEIDEERQNAAIYAVEVMGSMAFVPDDADHEYAFVEAGRPLVRYRFGKVQNPIDITLKTMARHQEKGLRLNEVTFAAVADISTPSIAEQYMNAHRVHIPKIFVGYPESQFYLAAAKLFQRVFEDQATWGQLRKPVLRNTNVTFGSASSVTNSTAGGKSTQLNEVAAYFQILPPRISADDAAALEGVLSELEQFDRKIANQVLAEFDKAEGFQGKGLSRRLKGKAMDIFDGYRGVDGAFDEDFAATVDALVEASSADNGVDMLITGQLKVWFTKDKDMFVAKAEIIDGRIHDTRNNQGNFDPLGIRPLTHRDKDPYSALQTASGVVAARVARLEALEKYKQNVAEVNELGRIALMEVFGSEELHTKFKDFLSGKGDVFDYYNSEINPELGRVFQYRSAELVESNFPMARELSKELGVEVDIYKRGSSLVIAEVKNKDAMKLLEKFRDSAR
ncbi:MAG: hypothetical protein AAF065_04770 [Verrucomicrobiota bacterium]